MDQFEHGYDREQQVAPPEQSTQESETDVSPATRVASAVGNQAFGTLARQGSGILPDGRAHPDVEATIARTRGSGGSLDGGVAAQAGKHLGDNFGDVRVHTDDTAEKLTNAVSAKAFTTGNDIYFAKGEYSPGSSEGNKLLTHELTHVVQQRGAPTSGPLTVSQPGEPLEVEADNASGTA